MSLTLPARTATLGKKTRGLAYPLTDGVLFDHAYRNGAVDATFSGTTAIATAPNSATVDPISVGPRSLNWTGALSSGHHRTQIPAGIDLTEYDSLMFAVRDDSGLAQQIFVATQDHAQVRISNFATITPPAGTVSGKPGIVQRFGGDADGQMRFLVVPLGDDDATLLGSPYDGEAGGNGLEMSPGARKRAHYFTWQNNSGGTRAGNTRFGHVRLLRRVPANMPAWVGSYAENALPLNRYLNYVPPLEFDPNVLFSGNALNSTFLPYQKVMYQAQWHNGAGVAGTTEQILEYAAGVFGFLPGSVSWVDGAGPPALTVNSVNMIQGTATATSFRDISKAQCVQEGNWASTMLSDWTTGLSHDGVTFGSYRSMGIGQQSFVNYGPFGLPLWGSLISALYKCAVIRWIFDGHYRSGIDGNIRFALLSYWGGTSVTLNNDHTYPCKILGGVATVGPETGSFDGFINTVPWQVRTWPWTDGKIF